jgi:hypothetical protein
VTENILLAGVPRAGTTLVCRLLASLPGIGALDEPMDVAPFLTSQPRGAASAALAECFARARASIEGRGRGPSKTVNGGLAKNHFGGNGVRRAVTTLSEIDVDDADVLAIKQPAIATAYLSEVAQSMKTFALVRNPLALLASWSTVDIQPRTGRLAIAEAADPALAARVRQGDVASRQLELLSWFFEQYAALPRQTVLRYEDVIDTGGRALAAMTPAAAYLGGTLEDRNESYDGRLMRGLAKRLLASDGAYWDFYDREDVEALVR